MKMGHDKQVCIAFAGGWSAGHVTPGLALAEALCRENSSIRPVFFGAADPLEVELVRRCGFEFHTVNASPWAQQGIAGKTASLWRLAPAFLTAKRRLRELQAKLVVGLGSHISVAPVLAANELGIPTVALEPNVTLGLANRLLARFVERLYVCPAFDLEQLTAGRHRVTVARIPVRREIEDLGGKKRPCPDAGEPWRVLVLGGSHGAPFLNRECPGLLARLREAGLPVNVLHQAGPDSGLARIREHYREGHVDAEVIRFCDPIAEAYRDAHFAITAAGAITLAELATVGLPCLVVPVTRTAHAHQVATAHSFARSTECLVCEEEQWEESRVAREVTSLLGDRGKWGGQVSRMRDASDATDAVDVVAECRKRLVLAA